jgi:hypothetical protein
MGHSAALHSAEIETAFTVPEHPQLVPPNPKFAHIVWQIRSRNFGFKRGTKIIALLVVLDSESRIPPEIWLGISPSLRAAMSEVGPGASVEQAPRHVGFTPDSGRIAAPPQIDALCQLPTHALQHATCAGCKLAPGWPPPCSPACNVHKLRRQP